MKTIRIQIQNLARNIKSLDLIDIYILLVILSAFQTFVYVFYSNIELGPLLSFIENDGWCINGNPVIGQHCFGDIGLTTLQIRGGKDVWTIGYPESPAPYPALDFIGYSFFNFLYDLFGYKPMVLAYLLVSNLCVSVTSFFALRKYEMGKRLIASLGLSLVSLPMIIALDRGNNITWTFPFLYIFAKKFLAGRLYNSVPYLIILASIRPQFVILLALFVTIRKYRITIISSIGILLGYAITFAIWNPTKVLTNIKLWVQNVIEHSNYVAIEPDWPYNYSLNKGFYIIIKFLDLTSFLTPYISIFSFTFLVLFTVKFWLVSDSENINRMTLLSAFIPLAIFVPELVFSYYPVIIIVIILLIVETDSSIREIGNGNTLIGIFYAVTLLITVSPLSIPIYSGSTAFEMSNPNNLINVFQYFLPLFWTVSLFLLLFAKRRKSYSKTIHTSPTKR